MSVVVLLELRIEKGRRQGLIQYLTDVLEDTRRFEGCERIDVVEDMEDPDVMVQVQTWTTVEARTSYVEWRRSRGDLDVLFSFLKDTPTARYFRPTGI